MVGRLKEKHWFIKVRGFPQSQVESQRHLLSSQRQISVRACVHDTKGKMHSTTIIIAGSAFVCWGLISLFNFVKLRQPWQDKSTEPPGPALVPWVGRIHDLPVQYMWLKFKEWADTYGPIYRTQMLGDSFIIISDEKIAEDLLVKRGKIYSDRPQIRSLFDPKSTHGSMEYLPLMGRNGGDLLDDE